MSPELPEGWAVAFDHQAMAACSDRALVLTSLDIPHQLLHTAGHCYLVVPAEFEERAKFELWAYEKENVPVKVPEPRIKPVHQDGLPGIIFYIGAIGLFAWLTSESLFGRDWLAAGRIDGQRFRDGEIWRTFTALTLHLDLRHLVGNMGFGAFFGYFAGRLLGSVAAWLTIIVAAAIANGANTLLLDASHRSIGASTAVFAALGLLAGFVWHGRLMAQDRWPYRLGPIVGGIALLAFTGTGTENTDIGAHLMGFVCGLAAGVLMVRYAARLPDARLQSMCGGIALALIFGSWMIALL